MIQAFKLELRIRWDELTDFEGAAIRPFLPKSHAACRGYSCAQPQINSGVK